MKSLNKTETSIFVLYVFFVHKGKFIDFKFLLESIDHGLGKVW